MRARWLALALAAGFAVPLALPALAADQSVEVGDDYFLPSSVSVSVGDTVTWNRVEGTHNVHFTSRPAGAEPFDQPPTPNSNWTSVQYTFQVAGNYQYICDAHPGDMRGTVTVNGGGTTTQPTNTTPTNTTPTNTAPTNTTPTDTTPADTTPASVSSLRPASRSFCARRSRRCRRPGLRFTLTLSEAATLRGSIEQLRRGRRPLRRKRVSFAGKAGRNTLRASARGLPSGRYRLTLRATDAAGNPSGPFRASFRIAR